MNEVSYLIVSSTIDYSTDLVCSEMEKRGLKYLRINRNLFDQYEVSYDLECEVMMVGILGQQYAVRNDTLRGIYFRAPVFYRYTKELSLDDQLRKGQWSSFIRNLMVFDKAKWINHPTATYRTENKMLQLKVAGSLDIQIPKTYIGNHLPSRIDNQKTYIVKALDTPVFYDGNQEMFTYSTVMTGAQLKESELKQAPVIIQDCLYPKVDYRVTIVGSRVFPAAIQFNGEGINGDWRKQNKDGLTYTAGDLPPVLVQKLLKLMCNLGLSFGGVDLIERNGDYYFIEVNPTGEWGWLVRTAGFKIHEAIVDCLEGK